MSRNAETLRALREKARTEGKCGECRLRAACEGRRTCRMCLDKHKERSKAYVAVGLCDCGADPMPGLSMCERCAEQSSRSAAKTRARRVAAGMCSRCGLGEPVAGFRMCLGCQDYTRDRMVAYYRLPGMKPRPCPDCGGLGHNRTTCERYQARAKAWAA